MHNRKSPLVRFSVALLPVSAVVLAVLASGTGVASAAEDPSQADVEISSFGLLGPVGLAAVALGVIGMALGVLRQRRKAQVEVEVEAKQEAMPAPVPAEEDPVAPVRRSA